MEKRLFMIIAIIGLLATGSTPSILPVQPLYSSPEERSDDPQEESAGDEPVDEPEPEPEPIAEPMDELTPGPLDDGTLVEREKECPKGEYDNGGKCTKIPQCTPPETWSGMEKKCRIFPWWLVMR